MERGERFGAVGFEDREIHPSQLELPETYLYLVGRKVRLMRCRSTDETAKSGSKNTRAVLSIPNNRIMFVEWIQ